MKELNFLPPTFLENQRRRRDRRKNVIYMCGLLAALGMLHLANESRIRSAEARLVNMQLRTADAHNSEYDESEVETSFTANSKCLGQILGQIDRLADGPIVFRHIDLFETRRRGDSQEPGGQIELFKGHLSGEALNEYELGVLVGRLQTTPSYRDVQVNRFHKNSMTPSETVGFNIEFLIDQRTGSEVQG